MKFKTNVEIDKVTYQLMEEAEKANLDLKNDEYVAIQPYGDNQAIIVSVEDEDGERKVKVSVQDTVFVLPPKEGTLDIYLNEEEKIMNIQEEILKIKEEMLEEVDKRVEALKAEDEFPKDGDDYWYMDAEGDVFISTWGEDYCDSMQIAIGNVFRTREEAEFAVEKLKVEAELRKFSRPFKNGIYNHFIEFFPNSKKIDINTEHAIQAQGVIYFEDEEVVNKAIESVGQERIKKYIFGVED